MRVFIVAIRLLNYTVCFTVFESIEPLLGKLSNRRLIKKHTPYFPIIFSSTFFIIVPANFFSYDKWLNNWRPFPLFFVSLILDPKSHRHVCGS